MRSLGFAVIGFVAGVVLTYGAALLWNPPSYESTLPLIFAGALGGPLFGVGLARRGGRASQR